MELDQTIRAAVAAVPRIATLLPGRRGSNSGEAHVEHRTTTAHPLSTDLAAAFTSFSHAVLLEPDGSAATEDSIGYSWFRRKLRLDGEMLSRNAYHASVSVFHSATLSSVPLQCREDAVVRVVIPTTVADRMFLVAGAFPALDRYTRFVMPEPEPAMSSIYGQITDFFKLDGVAFAALNPLAMYPLRHNDLNPAAATRAVVAGIGRVRYVNFTRPIVVPIRAIRDRACVCPDERRPPLAARDAPADNEFVWTISRIPIPRHSKLDTAGAGDPAMEPHGGTGAGVNGGNDFN
ncbi:hypothetical protein H9P43_006840 [Blastocladiella emersonii ATCC 22665]|nr:hypothetical protein H9P43_006840 [Blastocladiella emersonii ATCC 22665]